MSAVMDKRAGWTRFECPIEGCGFMVSGNLGQEPDDAIDHIEEEHWIDATDDERALLVADAATLGFDPVGPSVTCFCGESHITGACLADDENRRDSDA